MLGRNYPFHPVSSAFGPKMQQFWLDPGVTRLAAYDGRAGTGKASCQIADLKLQTGDLKFRIVDSG
jgi:hypothetical protein